MVLVRQSRQPRLAVAHPRRPTKLSLLLLLLACSLLAAGIAYATISQKHDARTRLNHLTIAAGFAAATLLLFSTFQQLTENPIHAFEPQTSTRSAMTVTGSPQSIRRKRTRHHLLPP